MRRVFIVCMLCILLGFSLSAEHTNGEESDAESAQEVLDCKMCKTELRRAILAIISLKKALKEAEDKAARAVKIVSEQDVETKIKYDAVTGIYSSTTCEWKKAKISCPEGKKIKLKSANYGRQDNTTCGFNANWNTNCGAEKSMKIVSKTCDNTHSCNIMATNNVFGDPCIYTVKYLAISFTCINESTEKTE